MLSCFFPSNLLQYSFRDIMTISKLVHRQVKQEITLINKGKAKFDTESNNHKNYFCL